MLFTYQNYAMINVSVVYLVTKVITIICIVMLISLVFHLQSA
jgi:hypothetical protein